jgi:hypothetical protein
MKISRYSTTNDLHTEIVRNNILNVFDSLKMIILFYCLLQLNQVLESLYFLKDEKALLACKTLQI